MMGNSRLANVAPGLPSHNHVDRLASQVSTEFAFRRGTHSTSPPADAAFSADGVLSLPRNRKIPVDTCDAKAVDMIVRWKGRERHWQRELPIIAIRASWSGN